MCSRMKKCQKGFAKFARHVTKIGGHLFCSFWSWELFFSMFCGIYRNTTQTYYAKNNRLMFVIRFVIVAWSARAIRSSGKRC